MHSLLAVAPLSRRDRILISTSIILITALAWIYLIRLDHQMSAAMEHDRMMAEMGMPMDMPWTIADLFFTLTMWIVMMVGMMAPSATPILLLYAAANARRRERISLAVPTFALGYVTIWVGFSAGAALVQWGLHQMAMMSAAMAASSPRLAGVIVIVAGLYQLTPWKGACLTHCRSPLGFLMSQWREGKVGAFRMGLSHGAYCLGCCWALMCILFAVGVMNLMWVAALAAFVFVEKIAPAGTIIARVVGAAVVLIGILLDAK